MIAEPQARPVSSELVALKAARTFNGETVHEGWAIRVRGDRIEAAGPASGVSSSGAKLIDLGNTTLMPGLAEAHSHILLHSYGETAWNDQVLKEGYALRVARATNHLRATLMAGFRSVEPGRNRYRGHAGLRRRRGLGHILPTGHGKVKGKVKILLDIDQVLSRQELHGLNDLMQEVKS